MSDHEAAPEQQAERRVAEAYARVAVVGTRATALTDAEADTLRQLARQRAFDPVSVDEFPPFLFPVEATNTRWDTYGTRMGASSLRNYAAEAAEGVSFLRNHNDTVDPVGCSLTGRFVGGQGNGVARVEADCAIFPLDPDRIAYINAIRTRTVRSVSIGFYGGWWECSLCGRDMRQFLGPNACPHLLGVTYTPTDEAGHPTGEPQVARATVQDAHLAEISGVFANATPGAMILKARHLAVEGLLSADERGLVEVRYQLALPERARLFTPGAALGGGDRAVAVAVAATEAAKERSAVSDGQTAAGAGAHVEVSGGTGGVDQRALADLTSRLVAVEAERDAARAQIEAQRAALEAATTRVVAMERAARRQRLTEIVTGARDGLRWPGELDANVARLERLAETWGEDSEDFTGFLAQMRGVAEQVRQANLFAEVGSAVAGATSSRTSAAQGRLDALVAELRAKEPTLSKALAEVRVLEQHPELYEQLHGAGAEVR